MAALTLVVGLGMEGGSVEIWKAGHGTGDVDVLVVLLVIHGSSRSLVYTGQIYAHKAYASSAYFVLYLAHHLVGYVVFQLLLTK